MTAVDDRLEALEASAARLEAVVNDLTPDQINGQSYPTKWTIAQVLSHLGSGAVIMRGGIDATVSGQPLAEGFNQSVWDEWNAKLPSAQASDALVADRALLGRLAALTDAERAAFQFSMGPFTLDLAAFLGLRLNEHVLHTWDIDVVLQPSATLPNDAVGIVVDSLEMITGFAGKSDGNERVIAIHTTDPARSFELTVGPERVALAPTTDSASASVELPSEAFIRLVYGRLDPTHTPSGIDSPALDPLRSMFTGV
jgi:uncharacterized protein (TIGR03083 family)